MSHTILVLDANQRSALAVTRSLGARQLTVVCTDSTEKALAGASRFCDKYFQSPDISVAPMAFLDWLPAFIRQQKIDFVFPVTERSSQLLLMYPQSLGTASMPFGSLELVLSIGDKANLAKRALDAGLPLPQTRFVSAGETIDANALDYPVVLKPNVSNLWLEDHWSETRVHIARSAEQLNSLREQHSYLRDHPWLLQEFIEGSGAGIFALYDKGEAVCFFAHRRLREKPPEGGVSVLSESRQPDPELMAIAKRLLDDANWHGVAMVEFRIGEDGKPYLMEVNTRFWGSLQLAIDSNVDFPWLLYCLSAAIPVEKPALNADMRLRWLLGDLDNLYLQWRSSEIPVIGKLRALLQFFLPSRNVRHEVNRPGDLAPFWLELRRYFGFDKH